MVKLVLILCKIYTIWANELCLVANESSFEALYNGHWFSYVSIISMYRKYPNEAAGISTRPDTRPSVADGWAGAEMQLSATKNVLKRSFPHCSTCVHGSTDRPTDRRTDRRTDKASYRVACPQLKMEINDFHLRNQNESFYSFRCKIYTNWATEVCLVALDRIFTELF